MQIDHPFFLKVILFEEINASTYDGNQRKYNFQIIRIVNHQKDICFIHIHMATIYLEFFKFIILLSMIFCLYEVNIEKTLK